MNSNFDSRIPNAPSAKSSPVRFLAGLVFTAVYWPVAAVFILIFSVLSGLVLKTARHQALGQASLGFLLGVFVGGLEFLGIICVFDEDLKRHAGIQGPLIIACNHPALWDALLVIRRVAQVSCVMKADLLENPLLRNGALFAGFLPNSPQLKMVRRGVERLKSGGRLLLFPEGTRTRREDGYPNEFRPGLALLAKRSGAAVLPVFIESNSHYLRKGWPIWRMPALPISITLRVGEVAGFQPGEKVRDFSKRLEAIFRTGLNRS